MRRLLEWLFPFLRVQRLLTDARSFGRVTITDDPRLNDGWTVSIRPTPEKMPNAPRYAWQQTGESLEEALTLTLEKVYEMPEMKKITGGKFAPKLGGKEFDDG
jgi:hypothetical protein